MLIYGHATGAKTILVAPANGGAGQTVKISNGWYAFAVPYSTSDSGGYIETAYGPNGQVLGSFRR